MVNHPHVGSVVLCWVILPAKFAGIEEDAEDLRVCSSRPLRHQEQTSEHQKSTEETAKEIERRCAHNQRHEEQLSFRAEDRQRLVNRLVSCVDPPFRLHTGITLPGRATTESSLPPPPYRCRRRFRQRRVCSRLLQKRTS